MKKKQTPKKQAPQKQAPLEIVFGAIAKKLVDQITMDGLSITNKACIAHCQKDADAVTRLAIRGILPDSCVTSARGKIFKRICEYVSKP
jgi:hypothetical protein